MFAADGPDGERMLEDFMQVNFNFAPNVAHKYLRIS